MTMHRHIVIEETLYFWFGSNDTSGSGDDGAAPAADVRLAGAAAGAAPVLSPVPILLTHANYPDGCYEVAVAATVANGFASGNTYGVFCTLTVDGENPTGFVGSFIIEPIIANIVEISGDSPAADNLETACDGGAYNVGGGAVVSASVTGNVGGNVTGSVGSIGAGGIAAAAFVASAIDANALATDAVNEIADGVLGRAVSNVEATADTASLAALILAAFESRILGAVWTIYETDHITVFAVRTVTTDAAADPIVEVT